MKKLIINNTILTFALLLLMSAPLTSFASDMWSETPDFKHDSGIDTLVSGSATFSIKNPAIDMWDETPDLLKEKKEQIGPLEGGHIKMYHAPDTELDANNTEKSN